MALEQRQIQSQKLILTQSMRQDLEMLQLPAQELKEYLEDKALSNPVLELEYPAREEPAAVSQAPSAEAEDPENWDARTGDSPAGEQNFAFFTPQFSGADEEGRHSLFDIYTRKGVDLNEDLHRQIGEYRRLEEKLRRLCDYIIDSLSDSGRLELSVEEIARDCGSDPDEVTQALYVVQSLEPAGVGGRSLSECLILQLERSSKFNAYTIRLVKEGLPLLAAGDMGAIRRLLKCSKAEAEKAADAVRSLNPMPSGGYGLSGNTEYLFPEAGVMLRDGNFDLEMLRDDLPRLGLNKEITDLLKSSGRKEDLAYLKKNTDEARGLIEGFEARMTTMERLLRSIVRHQLAYLEGNGPLQPLTMSMLADELELNVSTVSRALSRKLITVNGRNFAVRSLLDAGGTVSAEGTGISSDAICRRMAAFIKAEDPAAPLTDEQLALALDAAGITVSRRTVAKYRTQLGIATAGKRKKKS